MKTTDIKIKGLNTKRHRLELLKILFKPAFLMLVFVLVGVGFVKGQVTVDATNTGSSKINAKTITVSHTTGTGNNSLMIVGVSHRETGEITVTYNDDALIEYGHEISSANARTHVFYMINPPSGTFDVIVTTSGDFDKGGIVGVMTFSGVDQNAPLNTFTSLYGSSTNPTLNNIPTATNELVYNVVALRQADLTGVGTGQTSSWNIASGDEMRGGGSTKPGPGATTSMSWTSATGEWSMSAVSIKPTPIADLSITKTVSNSTPYISQTVTFTLTASNLSGPGNSFNTVVDDLLPSGYTFVSASTVTGSYNAGTGVWDIGTLNVSTTATLSITAVVNITGDYSNTATITGDVIDNEPINNTATSSITACQAGGTAPLFNN